MRNRRSRGECKNGNLKRKHKNKTFWTLTDLWKILKSGPLTIQLELSIGPYVRIANILHTLRPGYMTRTTNTKCTDGPLLAPLKPLRTTNMK